MVIWHVFCFFLLLNVSMVGLVWLCAMVGWWGDRVEVRLADSPVYSPRITSLMLNETHQAVPRQLFRRPLLNTQNVVEVRRLASVQFY